MLRLDARPSSPRPAMCSAVRRKYVVFLCALPGFGFYWPWGLSITLLSGVVVTTTPATSSPPCMSVNGGQGHQVIRAARRGDHSNERIHGIDAGAVAERREQKEQNR